MVPFSYQHLLTTVRVPETRSERLWKTLWPPATPGQYTLRMERGGGHPGGHKGGRSRSGAPIFSENF